MRNETLGNVLYKLKAELGRSLDTTATADDGRLCQLIHTAQHDLADAFNWGFLKSRWDVFIPPGTRFIPFPTTLSPQGGNVGTNATIDTNRPFSAQVKWNNIWQPVIYGIDNDEFNYLDSDRNQVLDPIQRWQLADTGSFEVWPLPAANAQFRFTQNRNLTPLKNGTTIPPMWNMLATLDLDDLLIVYHVAVNLLAREKKTDVSVMTNKLQNRLKNLLGANPVRSDVLTIGRGLPMDRKQIKLVPMVVTAGGH